MYSGEKLVKIIKILYSQWMKKNGELFQPNDVTWNDSEDLYNFYQGIKKNLGLNGDVDEFYYYMNTILMNEESLKNDTLDSSNIMTPSKKIFQINLSETRTETHNYYGHVKVDGYFTRDQLYNDADYLYGDGYLDLVDYIQDDSEYIDGQGEGIEVEGVELVKVLNNESKGLDKFLNSLTESEVRFLKIELEKRLL